MSMSALLLALLMVAVVCSPVVADARRGTSRKGTAAANPDVMVQEDEVLEVTLEAASDADDEAESRDSMHPDTIAQDAEVFEVTLEGSVRMLVGDFFGPPDDWPEALPTGTMYYLKTREGATLRLLLPEALADDPRLRLRSGDDVRVRGVMVDAADHGVWGELVVHVDRLERLDRLEGGLRA